MDILVPQGIGDAVWALTKVEALKAQHHADRIDIKVACWNKSAIEGRALAFLRRFTFVDSVELYEMPRLPGQEGAVVKPGPAADEQGHYRYIDDGPSELPGVDFVLMPNAALESGVRLDAWLPSIPTSWTIMDRFRWEQDEVSAAESFEAAIGPLVVFFMGCINGNGVAGHNRGGLWSPEEWVALGERLHAQLGVHLVVVGAEYDASYYAQRIAPLVGSRPYWINRIAAWEINQTLAVMNRARFVVSYQSGLGVVSHYLRRPTAMWWRPKGDSISPAGYVSPDEAMATAWTYPDAGDSYLPLIYKRESVGDIVSEIERRQW